MKIITLSGVDGSGKSTQLTLLKDHLETSGKRVAVFNAVEFSLANRIVRFLKGEKGFEPGKDKAVTNASLVSVVIREKFLFLDFLRFRFLLRRLKREGCDFLLSDRFFSDSLVNLSYLSDTWIIRLGIRFLEALLPRADLAFFLDIDPSIVMTRDRAPEQGIDYLRAKTALFKEKISDWNLISIRADRPKEIIAAEIAGAIGPITDHH